MRHSLRVHTATNAVTGTISLAGIKGFAWDIAISPDGSKLYLVDVPGAGGDLSILNALSPDGRQAYVAEDTVNMLTQVDTRSHKVTATWATSSGGWFVALAAGSAYVTDYNSASVSVATPGLDEATAFGTGNGPAGIALVTVAG